MKTVSRRQDSQGQLMFEENMYIYACIAKPYVQSLKPTQLGEMHGKEIAPYCIPYHTVSPLSHSHSQKSQPCSQHPHKSENECTHHLWWEQNKKVGKDVGGEEREGKDMATVQGDESVKQDPQTATLIVYIMSNLMEAFA